MARVQHDTPTVPSSRRHAPHPRADRAGRTPATTATGRLSHRRCRMCRMEYRTLGRSGCVVSTFALGTMTFGAEADEAGSHATNSTPSSRPAATWSTPPTSTPAGSPRRSSAAGWPRSRPASGTRWCWPPRAASRWAPTSTTSGCPAGTCSRRWTTRCAGSGVDCVDLYQVHAWDPVTPLTETLQALDDMVRAGKVRYVGLSNFTGWQVQKAVAVAAAGGLEQPVTLQPQYNLLVREIEWEIVPSLPGRRPRAAAVVTAGRRLADRQVHPEVRPAGATRLGENPERGVEAYDRRVGPGTDLGGRRRRPERRRPARRADGPGRPVLAGRPARRDIGDPRRPHPGAVAGQPVRRRAAPGRRGDRAHWTRPATRSRPTIRTAALATTSAAG